MEAFPHEGDMDMPQALAAYRDVGYRYMLMPDHVPQIDGRDPRVSLLLRRHPGIDRRGGDTAATAPHRLTALTFIVDLRCLGRGREEGLRAGRGGCPAKG